MPLTQNARRSVAIVLALGASTAASAPARADVKQECVDASTQGQSLRDAGKLRAARDQFVLCARDACPGIVKKYCADWLTDADRRLPTVVFRAQSDQGTDVLDARLTLDGAPLEHGLDGAAIAVDPGEHVVRFERDRTAPIDQRVVIVEGEKGRVITGRFPAAVVAATQGAQGAQGQGADEPSAATPGKPVSPLTWVLAGVGGAGLIGFAYFGLTAKGDLDHLRQTCAPYCSSSQLGSVKNEALAADVSLGVGVAALGAAAYLLFTHRAPPPAAAMVDVRPERGGGFAQVTARF